MNGGIENKAPQFHFWEHINRIFGTVHNNFPLQGLHRTEPTVTAEHKKFDKTYTNYPTYDTKLILEMFR
jgi:hypothetical protein